MDRATATRLAKRAERTGSVPRVQSICATKPEREGASRLNEDLETRKPGAGFRRATPHQSFCILVSWFPDSSRLNEDLEATKPGAGFRRATPHKSFCILVSWFPDSSRLN